MSHYNRREKQEDKPKLLRLIRKVKIFYHDGRKKEFEFNDAPVFDIKLMKSQAVVYYREFE